MTDVAHQLFKSQAATVPRNSPNCPIPADRLNEKPRAAIKLMIPGKKFGDIARHVSLAQGQGLNFTHGLQTRATTMHKQLLHHDWTVRATGDLSEVPAELRSVVVDARVPGCVHTDLMRAGKID